MTATHFPPLSIDDCLVPGWQVSPRVKALVTTRAGGVSQPPFGRFDAATHAQGAGGLSLGMYAGDDPAAVTQNRERLARLVDGRLGWMRQVHGSDVVHASDAMDRAVGCEVNADACVTDRPGQACVVLIADCLPVLLCDAGGRAVGAAHAGWRGLAGGVIERTAEALARLAGDGRRHAFLGPSIGPRAFEVGAEVRETFLDAASAAERDATAAAFRARHGDAPADKSRDQSQDKAQVKYLADLVALAKIRLARVGIVDVDGGRWCTVSDPARFYSYRRDRVTGRMAAMIWLSD